MTGSARALVGPHLTSRVIRICCVLNALLSLGASAQGTGEIRGAVSRADNGTPLPQVLVTVAGSERRASTNNSGAYLIPRVPAGRQTLRFELLGFATAECVVEVSSARAVSLDIALEIAPIRLGSIIVEGASRARQQMLDAPAAISVIEPRAAPTAVMTGMMPHAFMNVPGSMSSRWTRTASR